MRALCDGEQHNFSIQFVRFPFPGPDAQPEPDVQVFGIYAYSVCHSTVRLHRTTPNFLIKHTQHRTKTINQDVDLVWLYCFVASSIIPMVMMVTMMAERSIFLSVQIAS